MISNLMANYFDTTAVILFVIGFATLLFNKNLIKKIIGFNIMDTAIYLFLAAQGYVAGRKAPIVVNDRCCFYVQHDIVFFKRNLIVIFLVLFY